MNMRIIFAGVVSAALLGATPFAIAQGQDYGYGPGMMWGYGWGHGGAFAMVAMLLWWVLIILGIALIVKWLFGGGPRRGDRGGGGRALDILAERYARGEIDKKEFEERKRDLTS